MVLFKGMLHDFVLNFCCHFQHPSRNSYENVQFKQYNTGGSFSTSALFRENTAHDECISLLDIYTFHESQTLFDRTTFPRNALTQ